MRETEDVADLHVREAEGERDEVAGGDQVGEGVDVDGDVVGGLELEVGQEDGEGEGGWCSGGGWGGGGDLGGLEVLRPAGGGGEEAGLVAGGVGVGGGEDREEVGRGAEEGW